LKSVILNLSFIVLFTASCSLFRTEIDTVTDMLPRDTDLPGWSRISLPVEYNGSSIKKYKKDYHRIGIDRLSSSTYQSIEQGKPSITVEIIRFKNLLNSYGFFSRAAGETEFSASAENDFYGLNQALIMRGEYIIKAYTIADTQIESELKTFTKSSLKYIGTTYTRGNLNGIINILNNRDKYGIIYSVKPVLEQENIDHIYYTSWLHENKTLKVFISERNSFSDSYKLFKERLKKGYVLIESGLIFSAFKKDPDGTFSFISVNDRWIYGCWSSPDIEAGKQINKEISIRMSYYTPR